MSATSTVTNTKAVYTGNKPPTFPIVELVEDAINLNDLTLKSNELLINVKYSAFNPTDFKHILADWGKQSCVPGSDLSGIVVKIGSSDSFFQIGDKVACFVHGGYSVNPNIGAFQKYCIVNIETTFKLPDSIDLKSACTYPLGLCTVGISFNHNFKLKEKEKCENNSSVWILITGGTTSTGFYAIQIAKKIYGLKVLCTANKVKYEEVLKSTGCVDLVIDYNELEQSKEVIDKLNILYALDCVSNSETYNFCYDSLKPNGQLDNLLFLSPERIINLDKSNKNITFHKTLAYLVLGEDQDLNGMIVKSSKELAEDHKQFWQMVQKYLQNGSINHLPINLLPGGLNSVENGLEDMFYNKVSYEKLVIEL